MTLANDTKKFLDPLLATFDKTLQAEISGQIAETYISGQAEMITWGKTKAGVPIAYEGPPISQAVNWAEKHTATLVKGMDEETKRRLAHSIAQGIENKRGIPGLARDIRMDFADMSKYRSELIARTETANALSTASLDNMEGMGIDGKEWITAGDANISEECEANEAEGVIPRNQAFSGGVMAPPQHPDCRCAVAPARFRGQPYIGEPPEPTVPSAPGKTAKDIASTKEWAGKNVSYSAGNKSGQQVANQIINEVPLKDLKTVSKVIVRDGELVYNVPGTTRTFKAAGVFNEGSTVIEMSVAHTNAVTHEFGHAVMTSWRGAATKIEKSFAVSKRKGLGFVSEYAKTNSREYFAECYRAFQTMPEVLKAKNKPMYNLLFKRYNP